MKSLGFVLAVVNIMVMVFYAYLAYLAFYKTFELSGLDGRLESTYLSALPVSIGVLCVFDCAVAGITKRWSNWIDLPAAFFAIACFGVAYAFRLWSDDIFDALGTEIVHPVMGAVFAGGAVFAAVTSLRLFAGRKHHG